MSDNHRELSELTSISESQAFRRFLQERAVSLQEEVNKQVKARDIIEAYSALGKLRDIQKLMDMLKQRIFELRKEQ